MARPFDEVFRSVETSTDSVIVRFVSALATLVLAAGTFDAEAVAGAGAAGATPPTESDLLAGDGVTVPSATKLGAESEGGAGGGGGGACGRWISSSESPVLGEICASSFLLSRAPALPGARKDCCCSCFCWL